MDHQGDHLQPALVESEAANDSPSNISHEPEPVLAGVGRQTVMNLIGRTFATSGVLIMMFAAYQVWGTALIEWHAQRTLDAEFAQQLNDLPHLQSRPEASTDQDDNRPTSGIDRTAGESSASGDAQAGEPDLAVRVVDSFQPDIGDAAGRIEIPSIDLVKTFVEGTNREALRKGPGHYRGTPLPGQPGNASIAGHRTTNGAPFENLDQLAVGDEIIVTTPQGRFVYIVDAQGGSDGLVYPYHIVDPSAVEVLSDYGDNRLTLTACHPKFSARQRIVISASLKGEPIQSATPTPVDLAYDSAAGNDTTSAPDEVASQSDNSEYGDVFALDAEPSSTVGAAAEIDDLGWNLDELDGTIGWATVTALIAHGGWILGRVWRRRPAYAAATVACAPTLLICFAHLDRLLPAL